MSELLARLQTRSLGVYTTHRSLNLVFKDLTTSFFSQILHSFKVKEEREGGEG
jgi:hypothetical protein